MAARNHRRGGLRHDREPRAIDCFQRQVPELSVPAFLRVQRQYREQRAYADTSARTAGPRGRARRPPVFTGRNRVPRPHLRLPGRKTGVRRPQPEDRRRAAGRRRRLLRIGKVHSAQPAAQAV